MVKLFKCLTTIVLSLSVALSSATPASALALWNATDSSGSTSSSSGSSSSSGTTVITDSTTSKKGIGYTIKGNTYHYSGDTINIVYEKQPIKLTKTPAVKVNGTVMVPLKETFVKQGIKASYKYFKKLKKIKLSKNDKFVIMHLNSTKITVTQESSELPVCPLKAKYTKSKKSVILVPFKQVVKALGINYLWDNDMSVAQLSKPVLNFIGKKIFTKYNYTLANYAAIQRSRVPRASLKEFKRLINYKKDTSYGFQYLRLDKFRPVDPVKFKSLFNYYIKNACDNVRKSASYSVLYNKADVFVAAAKKYKIDPMYFVSQTFLETGHGTSSLARGHKAKKGGKTVTVYNLYGIGANDSNPMGGGISYALSKGWTSIDKAIYGAAEFVSSNYFKRRPKQNTIFKFRYNPSNLSHQYATDPWYAEKIAQRMMLFSSTYSTKATFLYDYPKFK